jgi:hypothetical protein
MHAAIALHREMHPNLKAAESECYARAASSLRCIGIFRRAGV